VPLVIVDSVWSIGGRHEGVLNISARLRALFATRGLDADATSASALVDLIDLTGDPEKFADQLSMVATRMPSGLPSMARIERT
jgi:hypothetical protein